MRGMTMMWSISNIVEKYTTRLSNAEFLSDFMSTLIKVAGLTEVDNSKFTFTFPAQDGTDISGVTGMVVLLESHLSLHTWPENGYMRLELSSCRKLDIKTLKAVQSHLQIWFEGEHLYNEIGWDHV